MSDCVGDVNQADFQFGLDLITEKESFDTGVPPCDVAALIFVTLAFIEYVLFVKSAVNCVVVVLFALLFMNKVAMSLQSVWHSWLQCAHTNVPLEDVARYDVERHVIQP